MWNFRNILFAVQALSAHIVSLCFQVSCNLMSFDRVNLPDVLAINAGKCHKCWDLNVTLLYVMSDSGLNVSSSNRVFLFIAHGEPVFEQLRLNAEHHTRVSIITAG